MRGPTSSCEYYGSKEHELFWWLRRRGNAIVLAIYKKKRMGLDEVSALHELSDVTEDQLAAS